MAGIIGVVTHCSLMSQLGAAFHRVRRRLTTFTTRLRRRGLLITHIFSLPRMGGRSRRGPLGHVRMGRRLNGSTRSLTLHRFHRLFVRRRSRGHDDGTTIHLPNILYCRISGLSRTTLIDRVRRVGGLGAAFRRVIAIRSRLPATTHFR